MEEDRAQSDLGIAADIEEAQSPSPALKQPKKRFIGRRAAANAAAKNNSSLEDSGPVESKFIDDSPLHVAPTMLTINQDRSQGERQGW